MPVVIIKTTGCFLEKYLQLRGSNIELEYLKLMLLNMIENYLERY
jgi:hypothetical protein